MQRLKPLLVQAFVPELAVEPLDVTVLHGAPGFDQDVANAVGMRPGHEGAAGELRPVVRSHGQRVRLDGAGHLFRLGARAVYMPG